MTLATVLGLDAAGVVTSLPLPLMAFGPDGHLALLNPAMLRLLDLAEAEALGQPLGEIVRRLARRGVLGDGTPEARAQHLLGLDLGLPQHRTLRATDRRVFEWRSAPLSDRGLAVLLEESTAHVEGRDRVEAELRELQGTLARLDTGVARYDGAMRLRHGNPAYAEMIGLAGSEIQPGVSIDEVLARQVRHGEFDAAKRADVLDSFADQLARGQRWGAERTRPNGRTIRFSNQPLSDGGWLAEATDISEKHEAEQEARRRAALLDVLLAALPVGVAVYRADRTAVLVNEAYNRLHPDSPVVPGDNLRDILLGRAAQGHFGEGDAATLVEGRLARLGQPQVFERRRPDGSLTIHRTVPLPDGGHAMVVADVTALQAAKAEARERAQVLQTMLENMRHGIVLFDAGHRVVAANRLAAELCGLPPDSFRPGRHVDELRKEQRELGVHGGAEQTARFLDSRGPSPLRGQERYTRSGPDGRTIEVATEPLPDGGFVRSYTDVTPLARAQEEARARAGVLEQVLDTMRHGIIMYDGEGRVQVGNRLAERLAGLPEGVVVPGAHYDDLRQKQDTTGEVSFAETEARRRALNEPVAWKGESTYQRRRPDGSVLEVRTDLIPGGGCVRSFTDVTALTRAEAEAASRAAMMQAMLDNMRHGIAMFDAQARLISFNGLCASLMGLEGVIRLGMKHSELFELQATRGQFGDAAQTAALLAVGLGTDWSAPQSIRRRRPDGVELEGVSNPVPGGGYVLTLTDITARVEAERQAERRASLLETTLNAARTGIALYGPDGCIVAANRLAARISGWEEGADILGKSVADIVARQSAMERGDDAAGIAQDMRDYAMADRSRPLHYQRRRADGTVLDVTSDPTPDGGFVLSLSDVTELVEAREEAQRQAAALASALDATRHSITLFNRDHRVIATNRIGAEIAGFPAAETMAGMAYAELARLQGQHEHPDDPAKATAFAGRMLAMDRTRTIRYQRRTTSGRVLDVSSDPTPEGGFAISISDVTALVDAQEEAQRRSGILQVMMDNSRQAVILYDRDRRMVAANRLAGELFGLPDIQDLLGMTMEKVLDRQHAEGVYGHDEVGDAMVRYLRDLDRSQPMRLTRQTPSGQVLAIASDPTPDGGFVVSGSDITPLARAEAEAKRRAEILSVMLGNIRHGIVLFDAGRRIVASNSTLRDMLGIAPDVLAPGCTQADMVEALLAAGEYGAGEEAERVAARILALDRARPYRGTRSRPDGSIVEVVSDPTPDGGWVVTYTDVTEDRHIRAELERARAAAEAANLAKSRFLATMSHELRTPLNAVIGFSEALHDDLSPDLVSEFAGSIQEAGRHLLSLIDDILDITRAEEGRLPVGAEEVDVAGLLAAAARMMSGQAEAARLRLELDTATAPCCLRGDERRMRQILLNLLSNSIKFTPAGGTVRLSAARSPEGGLDIEVRDSGIGIAPADQLRLFQPFAQVDSTMARRYSGSGLGLYLCRVLAEAQGAELTLRSALGEGTTLRLRFPPGHVIA
jgi:PAS domain S-box-containing protein